MDVFCATGACGFEMGGEAVSVGFGSILEILLSCLRRRLDFYPRGFCLTASRGCDPKAGLGSVRNVTLGSDLMADFKLDLGRGFAYNVGVSAIHCSGNLIGSKNLFDVGISRYSSITGKQYASRLQNTLTRGIRTRVRVAFNRRDR